MSEITKDAISPTTTTDMERKASKTGRGSRAKRTDKFRAKKNADADNAIMAGIFARLKITDPTTITTIPIARDVHPVTVPIGFRHLPEYVDRVWDCMEAIGTRPFATLDTPENKAIFKKGMLILSEVKVCYAQRAHIDKPDEELPSRKLYSLEELNDYNSMSAVMPYPLAMFLECIGNTNEGKLIVTPVLGEYDDGNLSGALTFAPRQLLPLLRMLKDGVPINGEVQEVAQALNMLPGIEWEPFITAPIQPNVEAQPNMIRLNGRSRDFWLAGDPGSEKIKWSESDYRTFMKIIKSLGSMKNFNVAMDLSSGQGSMAQTIQTIDWKVDASINWFSMTDTSEFDQKLGVAFGFSDLGTNVVNPSRYLGRYSTAYWRGELTPRRVMNSIMNSVE